MLRTFITFLCLFIISSVRAEECDSTRHQTHWRGWNKNHCRCASSTDKSAGPKARGFELVALCEPNSQYFIFEGERTMTGKILLSWDDEVGFGFFPDEDLYRDDPSYLDPFAHGAGALGIAHNSGISVPRVKSVRRGCKEASATIRITKLSFDPSESRENPTFIDKGRVLYRSAFRNCKGWK